jgi:hypothetical protein
MKGMFMQRAVSAPAAVRPYPGVNLLVWIGLGCMVVGLLLVLRLAMAEAPPPLPTARFAMEEARQNNADSDTLSTLMMLSAAGAIAVGFLTALFSLIARFVTRREYPADFRGNYAVRLVLPVAIVALVCVMFAPPVITAGIHSRRQAARAVERKQKEEAEVRLKEAEAERQLQGRARWIAQIEGHVDALSDANPDRRLNALWALERERSFLAEVPEPLKDRMLQAVSSREKELLGLGSGQGMSPVMSIYWQLDRPRAERLRTYWEQHSTEYLDPKDPRTADVVEDLARKNQVAKIEGLLNRGFDPLAKRQHRVSLFAMAAGDYRPGLATLLLKRGVPADTIYSNGLTAVQWHCSRGTTSTETVRAFLAGGADPNLRDPEGRTPLHNAILRNKLALVEVLLEFKADVNALDGDKCTPLEIAETRHSSDSQRIVELLKKHGAKRARELASATTAPTSPAR